MWRAAERAPRSPGRVAPMRCYGPMLCPECFPSEHLWNPSPLGKQEKRIAGSRNPLRHTAVKPTVGIAPVCGSSAGLLRLLVSSLARLQAIRTTGGADQCP